MKSRISSFNFTALKKDITRFAPAWAIYLVGCLLVLLNIISEHQSTAAVDDLEQTIALMSPVTMIYALLVGELLFGDLFNPRLCNALHAMPLKREGWFAVHTLAGLLFGLVPHLVLALSFLPRLDYDWPYAFIWLLAVDLEYVFFFSLAVFCAFCTGSRFAMALVYGLINFASMLAAWLVDALYVPRLYGVELDYDAFYRGSPVIRLGQGGDFFVGDLLQPLAKGWLYLGIVTVLGLVLLGLALVLYKRRKLECAGDFLAVNWLRPVFHVLYSLAAGTVFYGFGALFLSDGELVFLAVGLILGWFTGSMLLQRQIKVFRLRSFLGLAALLAAMFTSIWLTDLDVLGLQQWVPRADQVKAISYLDFYSSYDLTLETPEELELGVQLHQQILEAGEQGPDYGHVALTYKMKDGREIQRKYRIIANTPAEETLARLFGSAEFLLGYEDWASYLASVQEVACDLTDLLITGEAAQELLTAVKLDCEAGNMNQSWAYHEGFNAAARLQISTKNQHGFTVWRDVLIWEDCWNTMEWLEAHGYLDSLELEEKFG